MIQRVQFGLKGLRERYGSSQICASREITLVTLGLTLLSGCQFDDSATDTGTASSYHITSVLPTPSESGGKVTLYGDFPKGSRVKIEGEVIVPKEVVGGLEVNLSNKLWAGVHSLSIEGKDAQNAAVKLAGQITVVPKVLKAEPQGLDLYLTGVGWRKDNLLMPNTWVDLDGVRTTAKLQGYALVVPLSGKQGYGDFTVQVGVGTYQSLPLIVVHRAGIAKGKVLTPDQLSSSSWTPRGLNHATAPKHIQSLSSQEQSTLRGLVVFAQPGQLERLSNYLKSLPNLEHLESIKPLSALTLRFKTNLDARAAFAQLNAASSSWGIRMLEWDVAVQSESTQIQAFPWPTQARSGSTPSSSKFFSQAENLGDQWFWVLMNVPTAWQTTQGEGVTVAVVDSGVLTTHPALKDNLLPGYDFVSNDDDPQDTSGHGTHVSGLIAARATPEMPNLSGAAPRARILPVRVLQNEGGDASKVATGLLWAAGLLDSPPNPNPAQIINMSLGSNSYSEALALAVQQVVDRGILIVAATGNSSSSLSYPAALDGVLAVTSVAGPDKVYQPSYANRGLGVGIAAYGGDYVDRNGDGVLDAILSTDRTPEGLPGYGLRAGTSMASPEVAGIAALALSSGVPANQLKDTLERTAHDLGVAGYDTDTGFGLVDASSIYAGGTKIYILALLNDQIISWTAADANGNYTLNNLPPEIPLQIIAVSDQDRNTRLGESGEWISVPLEQKFTPGQTLSLADLVLTVSDGSTPYVLP